MRREDCAGADDRRHREPRGRIADARRLPPLRGDGRRTHVRPGAERERSELRIGVLLKRKAESDRKKLRKFTESLRKPGRRKSSGARGRKRRKRSRTLANRQRSNFRKRTQWERDPAHRLGRKPKGSRKRPKELTQNHRKSRRKLRRKKIRGKFSAKPIRPRLN